MSSRALRLPRSLTLAAMILAQAGCYYRVADRQSGAVYYTHHWVAAHGYQGPLEFADHAGRTVSLRASRVERIGRDEYREAVDAETAAHFVGEPAGSPDSYE